MTDERIKGRDVAVWREVMAHSREVVLHWRAAQADLKEVPPGGDEASRLRAEMRQLREEYARLIEEARNVGAQRFELDGDDSG